MQKWHFRFNGQLTIIGMEDKIMNIYPENIALAIRISDYYNENMSRMMLRLRIDKNLFDIIARNAKNATLHLRIDKFDKQDDDGIERLYLKYLEDDFSIFVADDINYNKDVDYPDLDKMAEDSVRKDVYKEVSIGLISKSCIEANKTMANVVFYKTSMMNMVAYYLQTLHPLIEPFTYNPEMEQLIVPPQETLSKTIEYLNNIKVFYDTNYLFFIDEPFCTYLISKSGKGIEKKDDIFPDVFFHIHARNTADAIRLGMAQDQDHKRFYVDINVSDTRYSIDHDTAKIYTDIQQIINPDRSNTISALQSVTEAIKGVTNTLNTIKNTSQSLKKQFKQLPNDLFKQKLNFKAHVEDFLKFGLFAAGVLKESGSEGNAVKTNAQTKMGEAYSIISNTPIQITVTSTSSSGGGSSSGSTTTTTPVYVFGDNASSSRQNKQKILNTIEENVTADHTTEQNQKLGYPRIYTTFKNVQQLCSNFETVNDKVSKNGYDVGMIGNSINCYTAINAQDGVNDTKKKINNVVSGAQNNVSETDANIISNQHFVDEIQAQYGAAMNAVKTAIDYIGSAKSRAGSANGTASYDLEEPYNELTALYSGKLTEVNGIITNSTSGIKNIISDFSTTTTKANNLVSAIQSKAGKNLIDTYTKNLKSTVKGIQTNLNAIGKSYSETLSKIRELGKLGGNLGSLSFSLGDLYSLAKSVDAIADLTGIGRLGKSTFSTALKLGQIEGNVKKAVKILNTKNDNSNKIKSIKAEMENKINQLCLNKYDLDPSVFTPNKKYTVKNYDGHQDKDGIFLLNKKTEIFLREDDTCSCNTMLEFSKLANLEEGDKGFIDAAPIDATHNSNMITEAQTIVKFIKGLSASSKISNRSHTKFDNILTTVSKNLDKIQSTTSSKDSKSKKTIGEISITDIAMTYKK